MYIYIYNIDIYVQYIVIFLQIKHISGCRRKIKTQSQKKRERGQKEIFKSVYLFFLTCSDKVLVFWLLWILIKMCAARGWSSRHWYFSFDFSFLTDNSIPTSNSSRHLLWLFQQSRPGKQEAQHNCTFSKKKKLVRGGNSNQGTKHPPTHPPNEDKSRNHHWNI